MILVEMMYLGVFCMRQKKIADFFKIIFLNG